MKKVACCSAILVSCVFLSSALGQPVQPSNPNPQVMPVPPSQPAAQVQRQGLQPRRVKPIRELPQNDQMEQARQLLRNRDYQNAHPVLMNLAQQGHAEAMFFLALMYDRGNGRWEWQAEDQEFVETTTNDNGETVATFLYKGSPEEAVKFEGRASYTLPPGATRVAFDKGKKLLSYSLAYKDTGRKGQLDVIRDKSGTCIELAALYCSMAHSVGLKPYMVLIPGHAFALIRLPSGNLLPVETTGVGGGKTHGSTPFDGVVQSAGETYKKAAAEGRVIEIDIEDCWTRGVSSPELEALPADISTAGTSSPLPALPLRILPPVRPSRLSRSPCRSRRPSGRLWGSGQERPRTIILC